MIPAYPPAEATKAKPVKITFDFDENQIREKFRRLSGKPFLFTPTARISACGFALTP